MISMDQMYPSLQGTYARGRKLVGYCHYHRKYVTINQLKYHQCLRKQCKSLHRFEWHGFWIDRKRRRNKNGNQNRFKEAAKARER